MFKYAKGGCFPYIDQVEYTNWYLYSFPRETGSHFMRYYTRSTFRPSPSTCLIWHREQSRQRRKKRAVMLEKSCLQFKACKRRGNVLATRTRKIHLQHDESLSKCPTG